MDRSGSNGKHSIFFQDSTFQLVFHVSNMIKYAKKDKKENNFGYENTDDDNDYYSNLNNLRKKLLGNDHVNVIWLENPYSDFDPNLIVSGVILIYIVIYPVSDSHYLIKLIPNKRSKFSMKEKLSVYFTEDILVSVENINSYMIRLIILLNLTISYTLQKAAFKKIELDSSSGFGKNYQQIQFDTNITQRYKEIERINYRFKNSI